MSDSTPCKERYTADAIANEFLCGQLGDISPMKIQKLVYYAHAWSLALFGEALISDRIEAWEHGPVVPALYDEFKEFGRKNIDRLASEIGEDWAVESPRVPKSDKRTHALIKRIKEVFGKYSAVQLSNMTHAPDEPWSRVPKRRPGIRIPDVLIKQCFVKKFENRSHSPTANTDVDG